MGFGGGGGGGGVADGVGTILKLHGTQIDESNIDDGPFGVNDVQGSAVFGPDGTRLAGLHILGEVDPLLTAQLGNKNATGGGVAKLRASDGAVLDGSGNPIVSGSTPPIATTTVPGTVKAGGDIAVTGSGVVTVPHLADKRDVADPIDWNTDLINKPGALVSQRISSRMSVVTLPSATTESTITDRVIPASSSVAGDEYTLRTTGLLNNAGGGTVRIQAYVGGVVFNSTNVTVASSTVPRHLRMQLRAIRNDDGSIPWEFDLFTGNGLVVGIQGPFAAFTSNPTGVVAAGLTDFTADLHMKITVIFGSAQSGNYITTNYATLDLLRP